MKSKPCSLSQAAVFPNNKLVSVSPLSEPPLQSDTFPNPNLVYHTTYL